MGYWANQPMAGDYPLDVQGDLRDGLLDALNTELSNKFNEDRSNQNFEVGVSYTLSDVNIDNYEQNIEEFNKWIQEQSTTNEKVIIKELKDAIKFANEDEGFGGRRADVNDMSFIIPLSFLDWEVKLEPKSELSQYLLTLLKGTDGGSENRGYPIEENAYPKGINTPSDFIKTYIDKWDDLISGKITMRDIKSTSNIKDMTFGNLLNTRWLRRHFCLLLLYRKPNKSHIWKGH